MPEKNYIVVTLEEVMEALEKISDPDITKELKKLYASEGYNELGRKRIYKGSKLYNIFKKEAFSINMDTLSFAFTRASYEKNISVRNKLLKYMHQFLDNIKNQIDNEMLIYQISEDKTVIDYIGKFKNWDDYSDELVMKKPKKKNLVVHQTEEEKRKSYVMM